jgi:hypothetical protein
VHARVLWLIEGSILSAIEAENAAVASHFFKGGVTYETAPYTGGYDVVTTRGFTSYAEFAAIRDGGAPDVAAVRYDNEHWDATPDAEQQDPARYMAMFTKLAHTRGYKVILTPAVDLMSVATATCHATTGEDSNAAFLRCGIAAAAAAAGGDVYDIQAQGLQDTPDAYAGFALAAAAQAHQADGGAAMIVIAGVTTDRGAEDTPANMFESAIAVLGKAAPGDVVGFWLNSMTSPSSEITTSTEFLAMLQDAGY